MTMHRFSKAKMVQRFRAGESVQDICSSMKLKRAYVIGHLNSAAGGLRSDGVTEQRLRARFKELDSKHKHESERERLCRLYPTFLTSSTAQITIAGSSQ